MKAKPLVLISPATHRKGVKFSDVSVNLAECRRRARGAFLQWFRAFVEACSRA
jgi:hypothetical protein